MKRSEQKHTTVGSGWKMKNRYILAFFHGILISTLFYTYAESRYESLLFKNITASIKSEPVNTQHQDSFLLCAMHVCHQLLSTREPLFDKYSFSGFKVDIMYPVTYDLMTGNGACGSYSRVLARILQTNDIKVRIAEMQVNGQYGGHITIEASTPHGWVALDPSYDLHFTTPQGTMADFNEVHQHWSYYKKQVPPNYNYAYNYAGVRYTNWGKIPILLPAVKKVLQWTWGKENTEQLSIRTYFLKSYHITFCCIAFVYLILSLYTLRRWYLLMQ